MISRLFFNEIAGKRVFHPYGRIGSGYVVKAVQYGRIESFLRLWLLSVMLVTVALVALHATLNAVDPMLFAASYLVLAAVYVGRIAVLIRRLKVIPMQVSAALHA
jgi:hypothetical protein